MKAAIVKKIGASPEYGDYPDPVPNGDQEIILVKAASIKNIDRMLAAGTHYGRHFTELPAVPGIDGIGTVENGTRVYAGSVPPYGMMAEKSITVKNYFVPIPEGIDDITAAAIPNPGVSAWLSLQWRGKLKEGETVLILGATGVTGQLAVQLARQMGAGRVIALGRNPKILESLTDMGADITCSLQNRKSLKVFLETEMKSHPVDVVLDYLWGPPAELLLDTFTGYDLNAEAHRTRYIQIGEMAGPKIQLAAATLRSAGIELVGQGGGSLPKEVMKQIPTEIIPELMRMVATGKISIQTEAVLLKDIEKAWLRTDMGGKRLVVIP
jgi:NADPH:quinone reductase-like Zn-dependent oxidoreductase